MLIETTHGMLEESTLEKRETTEDIPCGWSVETKYYLDGELVRSDINIRVKEGLISQAVAGLVGETERMKVNDFIGQEYKGLLQGFTEQIGEKLHAAYPELSGIALSFNLPGFKLDIQPKGNQEEK